MCLGVPGKVLHVDPDPMGMAMGRVSFGGIVKKVCLAYTPDVRPGEYVVVHVGFAIQKLDENVSVVGKGAVTNPSGDGTEGRVADVAAKGDHAYLTAFREPTCKDAGVHVMMVLDYAARRNYDLPVRCAALMHDLGKGITPPEEWPSHHDHEQRSLPLIRTVCQRLAAPKTARDLALAVAEFHTHCHRAMELKPATLVKTLEKLDAFRRPQRFAEFLLCCEADARGRTGLEQRDYPQSEYFAAALSACLHVSVAELMEKGLSGAALGQALHQGRINAVKQFQAQRQANI